MARRQAIRHALRGLQSLGGSSGPVNVSEHTCVALAGSRSLHGFANAVPRAGGAIWAPLLPKLATLLPRVLTAAGVCRLWHLVLWQPADQHRQPAAH